MLSQTLSIKVKIDTRESNLLKSLERAISLQREDASRLRKKMSITSKIRMKLRTSTIYSQGSKEMKRLETGKEWVAKIAPTHLPFRSIDMSFMDIANRHDALKINRLKISMTIACSFIAVDLLMISIGYVVLYGGSVTAPGDPGQRVSLFVISAIITSMLMCAGVMYSVMKPLNEYEAAANWVAQISVDHAVKSLKEIGMTGLVSGAAAVEQLAWQKTAPNQPCLHTLTINQLRDEIMGIGNSVAMIEIELRALAGEVNGKMQICFSKETALSIANEILCIPPEAASREYTDNTTSTLKEAASIFGNQYISVISEHIRVPIISGVPAFKSGSSRQISETVTDTVKGKVEYALSTSIKFGQNKTGLLTVLLEPESMDTIITRLT